MILPKTLLGYEPPLHPSNRLFRISCLSEVDQSKSPEIALMFYFEETIALRSDQPALLYQGPGHRTVDAYLHLNQSAVSRVLRLVLLI